MTNFSNRQKLLADNAVNELLSLTNRKDIISFAGGLPAPDIFPYKKLEQIASQVIKKYGQSALQYCAGQGINELRKKAARIYAKKMAGKT